MGIKKRVLARLQKADRNSVTLARKTSIEDITHIDVSVVHDKKIYERFLDKFIPEVKKLLPKEKRIAQIKKDWSEGDGFMELEYDLQIPKEDENASIGLDIHVNTRDKRANKIKAEVYVTVNIYFPECCRISTTKAKNLERLVEQKIKSAMNNEFVQQFSVVTTLGRGYGAEDYESYFGDDLKFKKRDYVSTDDTGTQVELKYECVI